MHTHHTHTHTRTRTHTHTHTGFQPWLIAVIVVGVLLVVVVIFGGCGLFLGIKKNKKSSELENPYSTTEGMIK